MKNIIKIASVAFFSTCTTLSSASAADSRIATLCGKTQFNEIAGLDDVSANPDGYYVRSLRTQVSHGDPRIVQSNGESGYFLCSVSAATPDMDTTQTVLMKQKRRVKYVFVPAGCPKQKPTS